MIYYKVGSERLTEDEYKEKYPGLWAEMRRKAKWKAELDLEPVKYEGAPPSDKHDFSREKDPITGLDGRYIPQMARFRGDPRAVVQNTKQIEEYAKRNGYNIERHTT